MRRRWSQRAAGSGRLADVGLACLVAIWSLPYAAMGVGMVLDDWYTLGNARFDGALAAAGHDQWLARPGAALTYAVAFGALGGSPLLLYAVQTAVNAAVAILLRRVARRAGAPAPLALAIAALWVVIPNHTSLSYWPSAINIALAAAAALWGVLLLTKPDLSTRRALAGGVVLAVATVLYEAVVPAALVGTLALAPPEQRRRAGMAALVPLTLATSWVVAHWHPAKSRMSEVADWTLLPPAHLGSGLFPRPLSVVMAALALTLLTVVAFRSLPSRRSGPVSVAEWGVAAGIAVIALGTLPFARYAFEPLGAGDRVNVIAAFGTASLWAGMLAMLPRLIGTLAARVAAAIVVAGFVVAGWDAASTWSAAGDEAEAIVAELADRRPCRGRIEIVRTEVRRNVTAVLDTSGARRMAWIGCDSKDVDVVLVSARRTR